MRRQVLALEKTRVFAATASVTGRHIFARLEDGKVVWDERLSIPLAPMIGVIGVAPEGEPVNCGTPGKHGGNMDNTAIAAGATLYFPLPSTVRCSGAATCMLSWAMAR